MNNSNPLTDPFASCFPFQYAIKIANNRNEKRLSAITELTSTMSISKMSNGSFLEGDTTNDGEGSASNHHVGNCDVSERGADVGGSLAREIDPEDEMAAVPGGGVAVAEDRLRLVSPAPPPLKVDTGQGRMERDRDRDWAANKMGHNYGVVALVNSNNNNNSSSTNNSLEGSGGGSNSVSGGGGHQQHHLQPQPITSNLVLNKAKSKDIHGSHVSIRKLYWYY